jgi:hypothetical protein
VDDEAATKAILENPKTHNFVHDNKMWLLGDRRLGLISAGEAPDPLWAVCPLHVHPA